MRLEPAAGDVRHAAALGARSTARLQQQRVAARPLLLCRSPPGPSSELERMGCGPRALKGPDLRESVRFRAALDKIRVLKFGREVCVVFTLAEILNDECTSVEFGL